MGRIQWDTTVAMTDSVKYLFDERDIPRCWYNINADLPEPLPAVLHPGTTKPITADDLAVIFPRAVIEQEMSLEREIEIPLEDPVCDEGEVAMELAGLPSVAEPMKG
jgi:hypothetical protein